MKHSKPYIFVNIFYNNTTYFFFTQFLPKYYKLTKVIDEICPLAKTVTTVGQAVVFINIKLILILSKASHDIEHKCLLVLRPLLKRENLLEKFCAPCQK